MRRQAAPSPQHLNLAPGDRYSQPLLHYTQQQVPSITSSGESWNRTPTPLLLDDQYDPSPSLEQNQVYRLNHPHHHQYPEEDEIVNSPKPTKVIMTGNGFFVASSGGGGGGNLAKSKSGTLPDRYTSSSTPPRGFRDTFVSSMASPPPHAHQARSSASASPHHSGNRNSSPAKESATANNNGSGNKKWSFGGLFKRKVKNGTTTPSGNINSQQNPSGIHHRTSSPMSAGGSMSHSSPSPSSGNAAAITTHPHYANPHVAQLSPQIYKSSSNHNSPATLRHLRNGGGGGGINGSPSGPGGVNGNKYVNTTPTPTRRQQQQHKVKLSESELTSDNDSELEVQIQAQAQQQPASFKQNFLTRRLSRRKEKAAAKKKAATESNNGLLKVPTPKLLNNGKRVGSSPESLNNGNATTANIFSSNGGGPWPSWEITKKVVPQLQVVNNYSSSGSLSLSQEGSSKGSRAAAKEAVKARAVARRESFIQDSSSDEEEGSRRSSIQGSHTSLTPPSKGGNGVRRQRPYSNVINSNQMNNNYPLLQGQPFRPTVGGDYVGGGGRGSAPSSPAKFDRHNNNSSNSPREVRKPQPPGSPRWEARVVYTQENHENETPFIVKLPSSNRSSSQPINRPPSQQSVGRYVMDDHQQPVITAGLRVPISAGQSGGGQIMEEVHYANLPNNNNVPPQQFRSATPQLNYSNVNASTPPPPPRREYTHRLLPNNNQNFYRPVSCSYLDSYNHHQTQTGYYNHHNNNNNNNSVRNASPSRNINGTTSFSGGGGDPRGQYYETHNNQSTPPPPQQTQVQPQHHNGNGNYYYANSDQVDNVVRNPNPNFLSPILKNPLIRSPSEPPEIKVQYAMRGRNASTPTPAQHPSYYYYNNNNQHDQHQQQQQAVVTSKLGFPVRKLNDAQIPLAQSPVHMMASSFWRQKEMEATGIPAGPNPNHSRYMNRIRSADSSPLPIRMRRNSPAAIVQNSNESISSLSSFSAEAQSPHMWGVGHQGSRMGRKIQNSGGGDSSHGHNPKVNTSGYNATVTTTSSPVSNQPNNNPPRQEYGLSKSDREKTPQTACERLKVRNPSAPSSETMKKEESHAKHIRSLVELNNGKSPGRNLEDALNELEDMYNSLRLSDEDLLDRAERRDLPTPHQELRNAPLIPLPLSYQNHPQAFRYNNSLGSVESLVTGSSSTGSSGGGGGMADRVRAPPMRRSARPDTVQDDMARRRFDSPGHETKQPMDPRNVVSKTGSYMVLSPAFSPPVSPCPPETLPLSYLYGGFNTDEPNVTLDDVTFRQYKKANAIRIIDPQPKFGIPLGPVTAAPGTDYLHSKKSDRLRPLFSSTKHPDLVNDDIAFRNLRKDINSDNNLSKDWTPRLFSPTRENTFNYNSNLENNRKLRAIRSLSANITMNYTPFIDHSNNNNTTRGEIGKWNSFTDLHHQTGGGGRSSSVLLGSSQPQQHRGAPNYWRPSWVDQVEKVHSNETRLRGSNNKFQEPPEPEYWERKLPSKTVQLTPDLYDPTKPRRPWTYIILESFEKEKQQEMERIAAEAEAAAAAANTNVNSNDINDSTKASTHLNNTTATTMEELDDDVFEDARDKSKSTSPEEDLLINTTHTKNTTTNYANFKRPTTPSPSLIFPPLPGQYNHRRGSWVEPRKTSSSYLSASEYTTTTSNEQDDQRRKSWSDIPKDHHHDQDEGNKLFNPLPSPKKIKQINLDQFNSSTSSNRIEELHYQKGSEQHQQKSGRIPEQEEVERMRRSTKGEAELNAMMDMLIQQADTCGPDTVNSESKTTRVNVTSLSSTTTTNEPKLRRSELNQETSQHKSDDSSNAKPSLIPSGMTQKGNGMPVPKIPQKEFFQIDEPTKRSGGGGDNNNMSKQRDAVLTEVTSSSLPDPPPEIVAVSRKKHPLPTIQRDDDGSEISIKRIDNHEPNLIPQNFTTCSSSPSFTTTSATSNNDPPFIHHHQSVQNPTIDDLIDSINESLPELEALGGRTSSSTNKSHGSSLSSTGSGSPPSVPSPRPGSPTTITLTHSSSSSSSHTYHHPDDLPLQQTDSQAEFSPDNNNTASNSQEKVEKVENSNSNFPEMRRRSSSTNSSGGGDGSSNEAGPSGIAARKKSSEEEFPEVTNEPQKPRENEEKVSKPNFLFHHRSSLPSKSGVCKSQVVPQKNVSSSPTRSEFGDNGNSSSSIRNNKEKDKSYKRKSHLNRAFTDEEVPNHSSSFYPPPHATIHTSSCDEMIMTNSRLSGSFSLQDNHEGKEKSERCSKKSSTSIYKVPPIPSILTTNNHHVVDWNGESTTSSKSNRDNGMSKSPDNSISARQQLPPSPSLKLKSNNILHKVETFESRSSPPLLVKADSFSDAEGVSFIKKLLQKESSMANDVKQKEQIPPLLLNPHQQPFILKKSPSAGSTNSNSKYWSKFSNGQPIFFKKFFENKSKKIGGEEINNANDATDENHASEEELKNSSIPDSNSNFTTTTTTTGGDDEEVRDEDVNVSTRCSVAQKASFFMKLEHDQRFSKWRKNSLDGTSSTISPPPLPVMINPTTTTSTGTVVSSVEGRSRSSRQLTQPITTSEVQLAAKIVVCEDSGGDSITGNTEEIKGDDDDGNGNSNSVEPSKLSLKGKVYMFDKLIAVGGNKPPSSTPLPVSSTIPVVAQKTTGFHPVIHSSSAVMSSSATHGRSFLPMKIQSNKPNTDIGSKNGSSSAFFARRGSTSDLELNPTPIPLNPKYSPIASNRSNKTRSMYVNNDDLSEDGEVSSGGQEVADIISRSYENSPVARKKSIKAQKQPSLTKEIWRRCKVNEPTKLSSHQMYKVTTNVTHAVIVADNNNTAIVNEPTPANLQGLQNSSPPHPTTSSNLLQILTVLTSSNDELDESRASISSRRMRPVSEQFGNRRGITTTTQGNSSITDKGNLNSSRILAGPPVKVHVPHPDDESFQLFFGKSVTMLRNGDDDDAMRSGESRINLKHSTTDDADVEMNVVQRESDLLVMKKNVPLLRRKSGSIKSSRNPVKALAKRIDSRNQYYTETGSGGGEIKPGGE